jgi:hypothetical protein
MEDHHDVRVGAADDRDQAEAIPNPDPNPTQAPQMSLKEA